MTAGRFSETFVENPFEPLISVVRLTAKYSLLEAHCHHRMMTHKRLCLRNRTTGPETDHLEAERLKQGAGWKSPLFLAHLLVLVSTVLLHHLFLFHIAVIHFTVIHVVMIHGTGFCVFNRKFDFQLTGILE